jgi:DNA-binding MarR family transcriptional regulator
MPRILQIATVGDDVDPILVGIREFPVSKLILVFNDPFQHNAETLRRQLVPLKLDVDLRLIKGDLLLGVLKVVSEIVGTEAAKFDDIYINVGSSDRMMGCAALSAAFVNGVKAFGVEHERPTMFPVLKFSYRELVSDSKMRVLEALRDAGGSAESLNDLGERSGVEKSLLSYHIRGGRESKGLEELGLVEVDRATQGRLIVRITPMGQILLLGRQASEEKKTAAATAVSD